MTDNLRQTSGQRSRGWDGETCRGRRDTGDSGKEGKNSEGRWLLRVWKRRDERKAMTKEILWRDSLSLPSEKRAGEMKLGKGLVLCVSCKIDQGFQREH